MAHLSICVLGELQVLNDGSRISSFESDKVRALLAFLVVEARHAHRREMLVSLLWPDCSEGVGRHNLSQALYNLRLALEDHTAHPPYLLITRDTIQFNPESSYFLDLNQFNRYYSDWEEHRDQGSEGALLSIQMEEMADLYRGEFLQEFYLENSAEFEEWILVQREATHQRVMMVLSWLANESEQHGEIPSARRFVARQLALDPWREEAHYQMMRLQALDGQRSAALVQYETCRNVLADELGVEPSKKTSELYEQIRSGTLQAQDKMGSNPFYAPIHNLPVSLNPFIGREQELANLARLIADPDCRSITLLGPGGIGKTRLALQAAEQHWREFSHGAAFIPLVSVGSIEAVIPAIASGIDFAFYGPTDPKIQLLNHLQDKQMLLILDNVEHLLTECPPWGSITDILIEILTQAAGVKLLVTSREALKLQEEWSFEVQGLSFPTEKQTDRLEEFDAVNLFIQRARRAQPGWVLNAKDKNGIVNLCNLVEGMPLAIELAATWVKLLSPSEIAAEIEHSLEILNSQMRDIPERHRNMQAVFDHSWQSLSIAEKQVLSRLSVFRGGFQRQAAEQVANAKLSVLFSLMTQSLIRRTSTGRYDLHELIRQYAASKLAENIQELETAQEHHSSYYLSLLEGKDVQLRSSHQKQALIELSLEIDNIRAAWDWSKVHKKILSLDRASNALWYFYELHNWFKEGEEVFGETAQAFRMIRPEDGEYAEIQKTFINTMVSHCASFKFRQGKSDEAYHLLLPCVNFLRTSTSSSAKIDTLGYIGITCWELGKFTEAKEYLLEGLRLAQENGQRWNEAMVGEFLGVLSHDQGQYQQARKLLEEALKIYRQIGDPSMTAHVLSYLGRTLQVLGDYPEAEMLLREGLNLTKDMGYRFGTALTLDALGQIESIQGNFEAATGCFSESANLFQDMGDTHRLSRTLNHQGMTLLTLGQVTKARNTFLTALRLAQESGLIPSALNALTGLAAIETSQTPDHDTLELVITILQQPSSNKETQDLAGQLRLALEAKLNLEEIRTAEEQAGSKSVDELVRRMLTLSDSI